MVKSNSVTLQYCRVLNGKRGLCDFAVWCNVRPSLAANCYRVKWQEVNPPT
jgi:hypothetical protein